MFALEEVFTAIIGVKQPLVSVGDASLHIYSGRFRRRSLGVGCEPSTACRESRSSEVSEPVQFTHTMVKDRRESSKFAISLNSVITEERILMAV